MPCWTKQRKQVSPDVIHVYHGQQPITPLVAFTSLYKYAYRHVRTAEIWKKNYFPENIFIIKPGWVIKKCKLKWFGHVSRVAGLAKTISQGTMQGERRRGRQKKGWESHIFDWKGLKFWCDTLRESENKIKWRERVARYRVSQQSRWLQGRCRCRCKILNIWVSEAVPLSP